MQQKRNPRTPEDAAAQKVLGRAVRELRLTRGYSQEVLGYRAELHRNYVGAVEHGDINPTYRTLRALSHGLHVELSSLIRLCEELDAVGGELVRHPLHLTASTPTIGSPHERAT